MMGMFSRECHTFRNLKTNSTFISLTYSVYLGIHSTFFGLLEYVIFVRTATTAYFDLKQDSVLFQYQPEPHSELHNDGALLTYTTVLSGKHPRYTVREICTQQQYQMCILREVITVWCGMFRCQRVMIHLRMFAVFCKWTLLLTINTLDISRTRI